MPPSDLVAAINHYGRQLAGRERKKKKMAATPQPAPSSGRTPDSYSSLGSRCAEVTFVVPFVSAATGTVQEDLSESHREHKKKKKGALFFIFICLPFLFLSNLAALHASSI